MVATAERGLEVEGVTVRYGGLTAVDGVSLGVSAGEIIAVVGANGAGKSSLLRGISGLVKIAAGTVRLGGADITRRSVPDRARAGLAQVPEGRRLFPQLTVDENLRIAALAGAGGNVAAAERALRAFPQVVRLRDREAGSLSGGEQQLVAFLRALAQEPRAIMIDEPSLGLAPVMVDAVGDAIVAAAEQGKAILLAEQNIELALRLAAAIHVLHFGRVVEVLELGEREGRDSEELEHARQRVLEIVLDIGS